MSLAAPTAGSSRLTVGLILVFLATCQWSGVTIGPVQCSDLVLALLVATMILQRPSKGQGVAVPAGVIAFLAALSLANVIALLVPPEASWVSLRFSGFGGESIATKSGLGSAGLGPWAEVLKLALAMLGGWSVLQRLHRLRPANARALFFGAWLTGAVLSAVAAVAQDKGVDMSGFLTQPIQSITGPQRPAGLAFYPNSLALYCVSAIPMTAVLLRRGRSVLLGVGALVARWAGLLASDSRIGIGIALVATLAVPLLAGRRGNATAGIVGLVALLIGASWIVRGITWVQANTRLSSPAGNASDVGRAMVNEQSILDWQHSPIFGLGFGVGGGGISVPLGLLSATGLIGAVGAVLFLMWLGRAGIRGWIDPDVRIAAVASLGVLIVMCWQNNLVDRGQYLTMLLVVIWASHVTVGEPHPAHSEADLVRAA